MKTIGTLIAEVSRTADYMNRQTKIPLPHGLHPNNPRKSVWLRAPLSNKLIRIELRRGQEEKREFRGSLLGNTTPFFYGNAENESTVAKVCQTRSIQWLTSGEQKRKILCELWKTLVLIKLGDSLVRRKERKKERKKERESERQKPIQTEKWCKLY